VHFMAFGRLKGLAELSDVATSCGELARGGCLLPCELKCQKFQLFLRERTKNKHGVVAASVTRS